MKYKVLVVEDDPSSMRILKRVVGKAQLQLVSASSLYEAQYIFANSSPETFLCAIINYSLPDARHGEAIDFAIDSFMPVIVITSSMDDTIRDHVLSKPVIDYIPKENAQVFEYLSLLLSRLERNKNIGVLVLDNSRTSRYKMISLLRRHNFITYEAANAAEATQLLESNPDIKLMITDENIPDMSGVELVAKLRKTYEKDELSIIGLSSSRSPALLARFIKSGANDYLNKPFCHEEFFCRILQNVEHIENIDAIRRAANLDYLTGLPNRRQFFRQVESKLKRGVENKALAIIDLDHFKLVNDNYGHDCGDLVLKKVSKLLSRHFKKHYISRFGGEEFCVFLPDTNLETAVDLLEKFRKDLSQHEIKFEGSSLACTSSIGVTSQFNRTIESMLSIADENLYVAKSSGRNRVVAD